MYNLKINIIDGIMGSGKSTGMINKINYIKEQNSDEKFLVIVPYLDEINRYKEKLKNFYPLLKDTPPKRLTLEKYLKEKKDIICTHQLFLQNTDLISLYANNYNLVVDEALNSLISVAELPQLINSNNLSTNIGIDKNNRLYLKENSQKYIFTDTDISFLIARDYLRFSHIHENLIVWNDNKIIEKNSILACIKEYFTQNDIYRLEAKHELEDNSYYYISLFPIRTFNVFKNIYIMTYLWNAQLMKYYFDFYNATYNYLYPITVHPITKKQENLRNINFEKSNLNKNYIDFNNESRDFIISNKKRFYLNFEKIVKIKICENINIPGYKLEESKKCIVKNENSRTSLYSFWDKNKKAKGTITLSYSFYNKYLNSDNNEIIKLLKTNIHKFCKDNIPNPPIKKKKIIWTVFDCAKDYLKSSRGYITNDNYIPMNAKATNEYKDANVLVYLVNRFINPHLYNFIKNYCPTGTDFSEELYALSELIQWIWRSSIRDNNPICIYIPSERMLNILLNWINNHSSEIYINSHKDIVSNILDNCTPISKDNNSFNLDNKTLIEQKNINNTTKKLVPSNDFSKAMKKIKDEKNFKSKCIEAISKYIQNTRYEINTTYILVEEKLEKLNNKYPYSLIYTIINNSFEDLFLIKSKSIKYSSENDYINSLFKILNKNIKNFSN